MISLFNYKSSYKNESLLFRSKKELVVFGLFFFRRMLSYAYSCKNLDFKFTCSFFLARLDFTLSESFRLNYILTVFQPFLEEFGRQSKLSGEICLLLSDMLGYKVYNFGYNFGEKSFSVGKTKSALPSLRFSYLRRLYSLSCLGNLIFRLSHFFFNRFLIKGLFDRYRL